ncbi:hypothetical protein HELRODRAFT_166849 [Helobdella robusta]|uniref:Uncharacterized protein n=1 Tax=Helobdella robusta TaxID=6412 RepID=T1EYM5_HELRO|nr:hypothetical protein HELRODRAFT_166849 [Helobdella robusta]ESO11802.1 hypothetical protein HELRODRAFT_166849 [Helobdella robusta]
MFAKDKYDVGKVKSKEAEIKLTRNEYVTARPYKCSIVDEEKIKTQVKKWALRSALKFVSDGEVVREVGREFQRKGPKKAKADLAKECLTPVKKKREQEDDRKPGRLAPQNMIINLLVEPYHPDRPLPRIFMRASKLMQSRRH